MKMNIKFTVDGRKVHVVEELNKTESIVQEVFSSNNDGDFIFDEGERFVYQTAKLSDEVSRQMTWKEVNLATIEDKYESRLKSFEDKIKEVEKETDKLSSHIRTIKKYQKIDADCFKTLNLFLEDKIKYVVRYGFGVAKIEEFSKVKYQNPIFKSDSQFDLRLITLFGRDDGSMSWRLSEYADGSGCFKTTISPCETLEEAIELLDNTIKDTIAPVSQDMIDAKTKYNLKYPTKEQVDEFNRAQISNHRFMIKHNEEQIKEKLALIEELKK